ncbi:MAG: SGNH/GDSL hydrolase family protein [Methylophilaceae bacterium]
MMKKSINLLLLLSLIVISSTSAAEEKKLVNILCIGDSITQGGHLNDEYTYRLPLQNKLSNHPTIKADFIGTQHRGLDVSFQWPSNFDPEHEGYYGRKTNAVADYLANNIQALSTIDIAIIHLGSNDQADVSESTITQPLNRIIHLLRSNNSEVKIIIIQVPGDYNDEMHYLTWKVAYDLNQSNSEIKVIPLFLTWDINKDTFDGAHPNLVGQDKIANLVYEEINELIVK